MSMTYAQIVEGCRHRKPTAQRALYDELSPMAMGVCRRYTSNRDDANDMLQDGFVRVFEKIGTLRDPQKLRSWVYNIMVNVCIQHFRRSRNTVLQEMDAFVDEEDEELPYTMEDIVEAMQAVTAAQRMAFNLCCVEELPMDKAASIMRCSEVNVRALLCKARKRLRAYLTNKYKD